MGWLTSLFCGVPAPDTLNLPDTTFVRYYRFISVRRPLHRRLTLINDEEGMEDVGDLIPPFNRALATDCNTPFFLPPAFAERMTDHVFVIAGTQ